MQIHTPGFGPGFFWSLSLTCAIVNREIRCRLVPDLDGILFRTLAKTTQECGTHFMETVSETIRVL
jgi:hypothetical protein